MDMRALRARVIKFSIDSFWGDSVVRFDAPGAPVAQVRDGEQPGNLGDSIAGRSISEIHGRRSFRPTTASASRPGASSGSVNRYSSEFESVQPAGLSGSACQQTRTCQRRKRRVWRVQRGQRTQPWWLRAWPGWRRFQTENRAETQIVANVWDNRRPQRAVASSKTGRREVMFLGNGSPRSGIYELLSQGFLMIRIAPTKEHDFQLERTAHLTV